MLLKFSAKIQWKPTDHRAEALILARGKSSCAIAIHAARNGEERVKKLQDLGLIFILHTFKINMHLKTNKQKPFDIFKDDNTH